MDHETAMRAAIAAAAANPAAPFGAVIVDRERGKILARGVNHASTDPSAHGEIDALRALWSSGPPSDPGRLALYTTAEPCPMCQGALLWARLGTLVYGTSIPTLVSLGWDQIDQRAEELVQRTPFWTMEVVGGVLEAACDALFEAATDRG